MADSNNNVNITNEQLEQAIAQRAVSAVQSVSVDGMSSSYQSLDQQLKALSALQKARAARNPLGALKIFKIKSTN